MAVATKEQEALQEQKSSPAKASAAVPLSPLTLSPEVGAPQTSSTMLPLAAAVSASTTAGLLSALSSAADAAQPKAENKGEWKASPAKFTDSAMAVSATTIARRGLDIDMAVLKPHILEIAHAGIQKIVTVTLEAFEERTKAFNENIQNSLMTEKYLQKEMVELENLILNSEAQIKITDSDNTSIQRAQILFNQLNETCVACKAQWTPSSAPIAEPPLDWQAYRLRLEQQLLLSPSLKTIFDEALGKIATNAQLKQKIPRGIFICYSKPDEKEKQLQWVVPFLEDLRRHLQMAGLNKTKLDTKDHAVGDTQHAYLKGIEADDFVLLVGLPALLDQYKAGESTLLAALTLIQRKEKKDQEAKQLPRVLPLLISGTQASSFPPTYGSHKVRDLTSHGGETYFKHLCWLIATLYDASEIVFTEIWNEFLTRAESIQAGARLLLEKGLKQNEVMIQLDHEQKQKQEADKKREAAGNALLMERKEEIAGERKGSSIFLVEDSPEVIALKTTYEANAYISRLFYPDRPLALDDIYINLAIVKEEHQRTKEHDAKRLGRESKEEKETKGEKSTHYFPPALSSYEEIYGVKEAIMLDKLFEQTAATASLRRQLIIGRAGIGKSTLCRRIAYQWAKGELWPGRYTWLFWLPLRNLADIRRYPPRKAPYILIDVLKREYLPQSSREEVEDWVAELIRRKDKVLWLLDGWDEIASLDEKSFLSMRGLVDGLLDSRQWPHVLLTSRPYSLPTIVFDRRLEAMGFTPENINAYIDKFFASFKTQGAEDKKSDTHAGLKQLLIKNPSIQGAACIPLNLELICSVWEREGKIHAPEEGLTMTALYQQMLEQLLRRYLREQHHNKDKLTSNQVLIHPLCQPVLSFLDELAYRGMQEPSIILPNRLITEVYETCCQRYPDVKNLFDWILQTGFIKPTVEGPGDIQNDFYFIHLSFQEFFAARYFVTQLTLPEDTTNFRQARDDIATQKYHGRWGLVWSFTAGLLSSNKVRGAEIPLQYFWKAMDGLPRDLIGVRHLQLLMRCLEEVRRDERIPGYAACYGTIDRCLDIIGADDKKKREGVAERLYMKQLLPFLKQNTWFCHQSKYLDRLLMALRDEASYPQSLTARVLSWLGAVAATAWGGKVIKEFFTMALCDKENEQTLSSTLQTLGNLDTVIAEGLILTLKEWGSVPQSFTPQAVNQICAALLTPAVMNGLITRISCDKKRGVRDSIDDMLGELSAIAAISPVQEGLILPLFIMEFWEQERSDRRSFVAEALGQLGPAAATPTVLEGLIMVFWDKKRGTRDSIAYALGQLGPAAATSAVLEELTTALQSKRVSIQCSAAKMLGQLGAAAATSAVQEGLIMALRDKHPHVRSYAAEALGQLGATVVRPLVLEELTKALREEEWLVLYTVTIALGQLGAAAATSTVLEGLLTTALRAKEVSIRSSAAKALGQLGVAAATSTVLEELTMALEDKDWLVQDAATEALSQLGAAAATSGVLEKLLTMALHENSYCTARLQAAQTLGRLGTAAATPAILEKLITALRDVEGTVRSDAAYVLEQLGAAAAIPAVLTGLTMLLRDEKRVVQFSAARALTQLGAAAATPALVGELIRIMWDESGVHLFSEHTLGRLGAAAAIPRVLGGLISAALSKGELFRLDAIKTLGELGVAAATPEVLAGLTMALRDEDSTIRNFAARALGQLGVAAATPEVLAGLTTVLRDEKRVVQCSAARALGQLGAFAAVPTVLTALIIALEGKKGDASNSAADVLSQLPIRLLVANCLKSAIAPWEDVFICASLQGVALVTTESSLILYDAEGMEVYTLTPEQIKQIKPLAEACRTQARKYGLPGDEIILIPSTSSHLETKGDKSLISTHPMKAIESKAAIKTSDPIPTQHSISTGAVVSAGDAKALVPEGKQEQKRIPSGFTVQSSSAQLSDNPHRFLASVPAAPEVKAVGQLVSQQAVEESTEEAELQKALQLSLSSKEEELLKQALEMSLGQ